ncbi:hypothetical protein Hypma_005070 [Hypsizygus marmoreus]|uniref:Uncharacterized protein n=1 Tax=Hypsizygus marmoreus TaxID=39966 RepID=A0A369K089_HYPMA|nr:hypothetical protein Hypma_005070 [Hypsizygus marmoreus]
MFIPFISRKEPIPRSLLRRKGGGGGGGHGGGGGRGGSSSGGGSKGVSGSSSGSSKGGTTSVPLTSGGKSLAASPYGFGGGPKSVIPASLPFGGRTVGGGTRNEVYGTSTYGSGYPGMNGRGVQGRGFPFVFYPVVFGAPVGAGSYYLYREEEYGNADNSSRPGGPLRQVAFTSPTSTFHVVSDNATMVFLQNTVYNSCHSSVVFNVSEVLPYNSSQTPYPKPEQAIQFYRASSVVLTLDGYNNTAALGSDSSAPPVPLPTNVDMKLLTCINQTIGASVPLVGNSATTSFTPPSVILFFLVWAMWCITSLT